MSRKTRREVNKTKKQPFWDELKDFVKASEPSIANLTEEEIREIAGIVVLYNYLGNRNHFNFKNHGLILLYMISPLTLNNFGKQIDVDCKGMEWITNLYSKVYMYVTDTSFLGIESIGINLTLFSAEAMKKGFESLYMYVKFLIMTIYQENGQYRAISEMEQYKVKTWLKFKLNFQAKWGIFITEPIEHFHEIIRKETGKNIAGIVNDIMNPQESEKEKEKKKQEKKDVYISKKKRKEVARLTYLGRKLAVEGIKD